MSVKGFHRQVTNVSKDKDSQKSKSGMNLEKKFNKLYVEVKEFMQKVTADLQHAEENRKLDLDRLDVLNTQLTDIDTRIAKEEDELE